MSLKINSFGGPIIWLLRKYCSGFTSRTMLKFVQASYSPDSGRFIDWFLARDEAPMPQHVMIETINRCNGKCAFCPANIYDEKREYKMMSEETFREIIAKLKAAGFCGKLFMCVNNEPFIDKRIMDFSGYAKREIPDMKIAMISNGTLLKPDVLDAMVGVVDQITINDYSEKYAFTQKNKEIIRHIKNNPDKFKNMKIVINRRYSKEILATRAGSAPNKPRKNVNITAPCLYPFTDMIIFPEGKVGLCCNDCYEVTDYGNILKESVMDIWNNEKYRVVREAMRGGRKHPFCAECDVLDAGEREEYIRHILSKEADTI